jgi:hypothetical protein
MGLGSLAFEASELFSLLRVAAISIRRCLNIVLYIRRAAAALTRRKVSFSLPSFLLGLSLTTSFL